MARHFWEKNCRRSQIDHIFIFMNLWVVLVLGRSGFVTAFVSVVFLRCEIWVFFCKLKEKDGQRTAVVYARRDMLEAHSHFQDTFYYAFLLLAMQTLGGFVMIVPIVECRKPYNVKSDVNYCCNHTVRVAVPARPLLVHHYCCDRDCFMY